MPGVNGRGYGLPAAPVVGICIDGCDPACPETAAKSRKPHRIAVRAEEC